MATRTFLQIVNNVLRDLREAEVSTWDETDYSKMVAGLVNAIRQNVEDAWTWTAQRSDVNITMTPGTHTYALTGCDERAQVLVAWNDSTDTRLAEAPSGYAQQYDYGVTPSTGRVDMYKLGGMSSGVRQVRVFPTPSTADELYFTVHIPSDDWDGDDDVCTLPWRPIVEGAVARARYERGEDGGVSFADQVSFMSRSLADYVSKDAAAVSDELIWTAS